MTSPQPKIFYLGRIGTSSHLKKLMTGWVTVSTFGRVIWLADPAVLGAIIDLRHCLDLFDLSAMNQVKETYSALLAMFCATDQKLPINLGKTPDKAGRMLDCAVLNALHELRKDNKQEPYDSVRGPFLEGDPIYEGAGFRSHSHIQICVLNDARIKGYFRPIHPT